MTTKMRAALLILMLLAITAAALAALGARRNASDAAADLRTLRADLQRLEKATAVLPATTPKPSVDPAASAQNANARVAPTPPPDHRARTGAAIAEAQPDPAPQEMERRTAAVIEAQAQVLATTYAHEVRDPKWAIAAVQDLNRAHSAVAGLASLTMSTDCRATLCRVDFSFNGQPGGLEAVRALAASHPWPSQQYTQINRESQQGFMFIAREGFDLPRVDPTTVAY